MAFKNLANGQYENEGRHIPQLKQDSHLSITHHRTWNALHFVAA